MVGKRTAQICLLFILFPSLVFADLNTITIDACDNMDSSIAVDQSGNVHMSYIDDTNVPVGESTTSTAYVLKYASNASGRWQTTVVDKNGNFERTKIVVDTNNKIHIFYRDRLSEVFKHATLESSSWSTLAIDGTIASQELGVAYILAVDQNLNLHTCYRKYPDDMMYATNKNGTWELENAGNETEFGYTRSYPYEQPHDIVVDSANNVHICAYDERSLPDYYAINYVTNESGSWQTTVIETDISYSIGVEGAHYYFCSIALDTLENIHIAYFDVNHNALKYATNQSGTWTIEVADQGSSSNTDYKNISLTIDNDQIAHIAFRLDGVAKLFYKTNILGEWGYAYADGSGIGTAIAVDQDQHVHMAFPNWHKFNYSTTREIPQSEYPDDDDDSDDDNDDGGGGCFIDSL